MLDLFGPKLQIFVHRDEEATQITIKQSVKCPLNFPLRKDVSAWLEIEGSSLGS